MFIGIGLPITGDYTAPAASGPTLGPELLTNGDMSSATGWTLINPGDLAVIGIAGGVLSMEDPEGVTPNARQLENTVSDGATYRVVYTITAIGGGGSVRASLGGTGSGAPRSAPGTYQEDIVCGSDVASGFQLQLDNGTATIDNASVKLLS